MNKLANARTGLTNVAAPVKELNDAELSIATGGSTGAGAGKVTFNPFSVTRKVDKASPIFFQM